MAITFVWDPKKNRSNQKAHGVSFEEAETVFYDENARLIADPEHSQEEDRFILLGLSSRLRMLLVVHCYRRDDEVVRIISARKASRGEQKITHGANNMRQEYDFSKSIKNPYAKKLKRQITIRIENATIEYFQQLAVETDIPYQKLINLFLKDCAQNRMKPLLKWKNFAAHA